MTSSFIFNITRLQGNFLTEQLQRMLLILYPLNGYGLYPSAKIATKKVQVALTK